jgi:hypothetical protein
MVKSGLDPHMINILKDGFNIAFRLLLVALLSTNHKCTQPCLNVAQKKKKVHEVQKMVLAYATASRLPVKFGAFASQGSAVNL